MKVLLEYYKFVSNKRFVMKSPILLTPGPVPLSESVKEQLGQDMIHHRSDEIKEALFEIQSHFQHIFKTKEHVYILHSTGTGAMEAAITNTLSPSDEVLVVISGKFGERWNKLAQTYKLKTHVVTVPWGHCVTTCQVEQKLKEHPQIKAILIQSCETSTGTHHPIEEISYLTKDNPNILLIVDAISSLVVHDLFMDQWGLDVLIGGSQKSFGLPSGLAFISLSQKAQKFQSTSQLPSFYFNLLKEKKANIKGQTSCSSNVSFIRALRVQLKYFIQQGIPNIQKRSRKWSQVTQQFAKDLNLSLLSQSPCYSVTAISLPCNIDGHQVKNFMLQHNIFIGGGQDRLDGKIVRFGHLGEISTKHLLQGFKVFTQALQAQQPTIYTDKITQTALSKAIKSLGA